MQLKVIKADGSTEGYLHTKVIGTISKALSSCNQADIYIAEHLAEVVTYYLYHQQRVSVITSSEIFSIIKAVLAETGYEEAALALNEYHYARRLKRARVEVVSVDIQDLADAEELCRAETVDHKSRWNKSRIVNDLITKYGISSQTARTIASLVEEKIFNMGINLVPVSLIKQLVLSDTAAVLRAQQQLQTV